MKKKTLKKLIAHYNKAIEVISEEDNVYAALHLCTKMNVQYGICAAETAICFERNSYNFFKGEGLLIDDLQNWNYSYIGITPVKCTSVNEIIESLQARVDVMTILLIDEEIEALIEEEPYVGYTLAWLLNN